MHTSSGVDAVDEYLETVTKRGNGFVYKYGTEERPDLRRPEITLSYKTDSAHGAAGNSRIVPHASWAGGAKRTAGNGLPYGLCRVSRLRH